MGIIRPHHCVLIQERNEGLLVVQRMQELRLLPARAMVDRYDAVPPLAQHEMEAGGIRYRRPWRRDTCLWHTDLPRGWRLQLRAASETLGVQLHWVDANLLDQVQRVRGIVRMSNMYRSHLILSTRYRLVWNDASESLTVVDSMQPDRDALWRRKVEAAQAGFWFSGEEEEDELDEEHVKAAESWLTAHYPHWTDPFAYWDDPA